MGHAFGCWWPENVARGDVEGCAVPRAGHYRSLHGTFREWPSPVSTGVSDGVIGAIDVEESNRAPFDVDRFGRSGRYIFLFPRL